MIKDDDQDQDQEEEERYREVGGEGIKNLTPVQRGSELAGAVNLNAVTKMATRNNTEKRQTLKRKQYKNYSKKRREMRTKTKTREMEREGRRKWRRCSIRDST